MGEKYAFWRVLKAAKPAQYTLPVGMGRKAFHFLNMAFNRNPVFHDLDLGLTVLNASATGSGSLKTNKHDRCILVRQYTHRVMQDTSAGHHARGRNNDP